VKTSTQKTCFIRSSNKNSRDAIFAQKVAAADYNYRSYEFVRMGNTVEEHIVWSVNRQTTWICTVQEFDPVVNVLCLVAPVKDKIHPLVTVKWDTLFWIALAQS
jgi:hypothetical protein